MALLEHPSMPNPHREHLRARTRWQTECTCGYVTPWRPTHRAADKDRERHMAEHARLAAFVVLV